MYPEPGGMKSVSTLTRLPGIEDWERLERELEDKLESPLDELNLELDQIVFAVEIKRPTVNVYYSTRPQGLFGRRSQLDPMVRHGVSQMIRRVLQEVLGDLLAPTA